MDCRASSIASALRAKAEQIWSRLGSPAPLDAMVRDLGPSVQQVVDIARALAFNARVVIMDEPTATLTHQETERLFEIIRGLKRRGAAVDLHLARPRGDFRGREPRHGAARRQVRRYAAGRRRHDERR